MKTVPKSSVLQESGFHIGRMTEKGRGSSFSASSSLSDTWLRHLNFRDTQPNSSNRIVMWNSLLAATRREVMAAVLSLPSLDRDYRAVRPNQWHDATIREPRVAHPADAVGAGIIESASSRD